MKKKTDALQEMTQRAYRHHPQRHALSSFRKALKPADAASTDYLLAGLDVSVSVARLLYRHALEGVPHAVAVQVI